MNRKVGALFVPVKGNLQSDTINCKSYVPGHSTTTSPSYLTIIFSTTYKYLQYQIDKCYEFSSAVLNASVRKLPRDSNAADIFDFDEEWAAQAEAEPQNSRPARQQSG
jgi:hypothetical protein